LPAITIAIVLANLAFTYQGFRDRYFFARYDFHIEPILRLRDYRRLVTSGFLHVNWVHFLFNMFALYSFSISVLYILGTVRFLIVYFGSLLAGNLLSLYIHRNHMGYRAVGASGAVAGVIFSSIVLFPQGEIGMLFIPVGIPSWLFGILFVLVSIFGISSRLGNVGHGAHLGGALCGLFLTLLIKPMEYPVNALLVITITIPGFAYIAWIVRREGAPRFGISFREWYRAQSEKRRAHEEEAIQKELDRLLEKVNEQGINALSDWERKRLHEISERRKKNRR